MSLQKCGLNMNSNLKELQPHGTLDFPCAGYEETYTDRISDEIPWHWHEELEIIYLKKGSLKLQVPSKEYIMNAGELAVINTNVLHYATAMPYCELQSLVFSHLLLTGNNTSVFFLKYMQPLMSCPDFVLLTGLSRKMIAHFKTAFHALSTDSPGYEFIVREHLSQIMLYCYQKVKEHFTLSEKNISPDTVRIEKMFYFIQSHYSDSINLTDIASAADIGERECLRCFKRTIGDSPIQYLLKYRLMQSASMLQNSTADISEIATACGFDYSSYYSKQFRRFYQCSPKEYRAAHLEQNY